MRQKMWIPSFSVDIFIGNIFFAFRALLVSHGVRDVRQVVDALARPEKSSGQPVPVFRSRFARRTWRSG